MATEKDGKARSVGKGAGSGKMVRPAGHILKSADKAKVFDLIPGMVLVMDTEHTILELNELAARAAG